MNSGQKKISQNLKSPLHYKVSLTRPLFYLLLILVITFIVYTPARNNEFTNWDDEAYVVKNTDITSFEKYKHNLLTKSYEANYHPLTMLSYAFDYSIGKLNPKIYHRTNILLHLANAVLVFWLITLLTGNIEVGLICGILFGVHPLHVESVAWVSERKNVLYTLFFLSSLISYIKYLQEEKIKFYYWALFLFVLSLLSKAMAVSLTVTLLAVDYLLDRKLLSKKVLLEKTPFFALSMVFGIMAIHFQPIALHELDQSRTVQVNSFFYEKILFAIYNIGQYILKLLAPLKLAIFYPYPGKQNGMLPLKYYIVPVLIFIFLAAAFILLIKRKGYYSKFILFGFLFFILNIALVLQLIPVGGAIMADRYAYIPSIGIFLFIGLGYKYLSTNKIIIRNLFVVVLVLYCATLSRLTYVRCNIWHDGITLWTDQIKKYPDMAFAYNSRGLAKYELKDYDGAFEDYKKSAEVDPFFYEAYCNKGLIELKRHNYSNALENFNKVLKNTNNTYVYINRGRTKYLLKDYKGSIADYSTYLKFYPNDHEAYFLRGQANFYFDNDSIAMADYNKAIEIMPDYADAYTHRGILRSVLNDFRGAMADFNKAEELNPSYALNYYNRAKLKFFIGLNKEACVDLQKAVQYGLHEAGKEFNQYCK